MKSAKRPARPARRLALFGLLTVIGLGIGQLSHAGRSERQEKVAEPTDPLLSANLFFRTTYAQRRADRAAKIRPLLILAGDQLVLLHQGKRQQARIIPPIYEALKTVSHIPLSIYLLSTGDPMLDASASASLEQLRGLLGKLRPLLDKQGFTPQQRERQSSILDAAERFIAKSLAASKTIKDETLAFTREVGPLLQENASDSAAAELNTLHAQVQAWRQQISEEDWKHLHVIVMGSKMPRKDNLAMQYFARLLGETGESNRLLYSEGIFDEARALGLLGTVQLDTDIGEAFFKDGQYMHRDLLAEGAARHLKELSFDRVEKK